MAQLLLPFSDGYLEYLSDESRRSGTATHIAFPTCAEELSSIFNELETAGLPFTIQGARTGLDGAAIPQGGAIINCTAMDSFISLRRDSDGAFLLRAGCGVTLSALERCLTFRDFPHSAWDADSLATLEELKDSPSLFWPPSPTESGATIGGTVAGNARGIYSYRYGNVQDYVFDPVYAGSVLSEMVLKLIPMPESVWGLAFFFESEGAALDFAREVHITANPSIAAIEFLNKPTLENIALLRETASRLQALPEIDERFRAMIYTEIHAALDDEAEDCASLLLDIAAQYGSDLDSSWALSGDSEVARIRIIRHAAQEASLAAFDRVWGGTSNIYAPGIDISLPGNSPRDELAPYEQALAAAGLGAAIFGNPGGGRLRICPAPQSIAEFEVAKSLIAQWKEGAPL